MDSYGDSGVGTTSKLSRKRRSNLYRRPLNEAESPQDCHESVSLSSTPDHVSDAPSDGNAFHGDINRGKGNNSMKCVSTSSYTNLADSERVHKNYDEGGVFGESANCKFFNEDNPAAFYSKSLKMKNSTVSDAVICHQSPEHGAVADETGAGNRLNKVKLKVGGVTHTIHTRSSLDGSSVSGTSAASLTNSTPSDATYPAHKLSTQENVYPRFTNEKGGLRGVPWKDFSKFGFSFGKVNLPSVYVPEDLVQQNLKHGRPSRGKSKYLSDEMYAEEEDDDDEEIRYLKKLRTSKITSSDSAEYEDETRVLKFRKISRVMDRDIDGNGLVAGDYNSRPTKGSKKSRNSQASEDTEYLEDEELVSDGEVENKNRNQRKEQIEIPEYSKKESSITTRRRAILTGREISLGLGAGSIQFPDGLPRAPPKKPKEQPTEVEQQLKRAEAAQRRRIQNEKAARESEAEAIRKILGQDSSRKRREEKIKKRQEELAQERSATAGTLGSGVIRLVIGPSGTVVTFPEDIGLPSIFEPKPCSYPPPREKCAGPSCTNAYKYRDSKSKLPLCSLQCYKAVHGKSQSLHAF